MTIIKFLIGLNVYALDCIHKILFREKAFVKIDGHQLNLLKKDFQKFQKSLKDGGRWEKKQSEQALAYAKSFYNIICDKTIADVTMEK